MSLPEQIRNWLTIGLQQPKKQFSEMFYYDKKDNEFFSILASDYFMFDDNLNVAKNMTTTYSAQNTETLKDRIGRIENNDNSIIPIPRFGNANDVEFIADQIESFLNLNSIDIRKTKIWEPEGSTITINLKGRDKL
ncbi:MAG: hypothetical protein M3R17_18370 [Bacteroidota bacterium]|nr:hypothetical protein [Bacteroidota bacterium]